MMPSAPARPDPDALLKQARREGRGKLKVFLGASPGVGKTYEMLSEAAALRRGGRDVVIGVVETHGRQETAALLGDLEQVPSRTVEYHGRSLHEMDLDAVLARRPGLVLVDELAHTNIPGSRHPKRWQDVEELLAAGIDVFSTVNIQHLESLNDTVTSFTRVRVRETVPDSVLEQAELEIVDIPPDELIERLKEGKVYVPEEASRALGHFFSRSNLAALRELTLRQGAQVVDARMLDDLDAEAAQGTWAAGERVLVAVSELPGCEALVRAAKRLADSQRAKWTALHIETPRSATFDGAQRKQVASVLQLAGELGATVASLPATSVLEGLKTYAAQHRITQVVVGKSNRSRWFELRHGSVVDRLVRDTPGIAVHVLPFTPEQPARLPSQGKGRALKLSFRDGGVAIALVAAVTAVGRLINIGGNVTDVALLYLVPVMFCAMRAGLLPGLLAGILSALAYNFFFLPPTGTFTITDPANIVTVGVLLGVAVATSHLASGLRSHIDIAQRSARANAVLAGFARRLSGSATVEDIARALVEEIETAFAARATVLRRDAGGLVPVPGLLPLELGAIDTAAAEWAETQGQPAGIGTQTLTASDLLFQPLRVANSTLGVVGVGSRTGDAPIRGDQMPLYLGLLDQATLALERERLSGEARQVDVLQERDRLRSTLLSSVGHDLRTPLAAVRGAISELRHRPVSDLIDTLESESQRLELFFENLLDMTRIETGAVEVSAEPVDLTDAIAQAVHDMRRQLQGRRIDLDVAVDLPLVTVDPRLFHHCLINLIGNAAKFSREDGPIAFRAMRRPGSLTLAIEDEGVGLLPGDETRVFDTFRQLAGSDRSGGSGLGLAIVKGFAEAMGMTVSAANRHGSPGARFELTFPERLLVRASVEP